MTVPDKLPDDIAELKAIIRAQQDQNAQLEALIASFKKALFGAKSEKIDPAQYELELEDIETAIAQVEAEIDADERSAPVRPPKPHQTNRGSLPKHMERVEVVIEPERSCACGAERHVIGEDIGERLDIIPAQFQVIVTRRPKYACRSCEGGIAQAPAPAHIIAGGMPTEATLAHVLVSKYADHLPLYRQALIYSRQGIDLDRSTLAAWVGKSAFELTPVYEALIADLKCSTKLFMDETPAAVLAPGRKRTKTGYFWALHRGDRPWGGDDPPGVAFTYGPGRSGQHSDNILKGFSGTLQVDGYAGYNRLLKRPTQHVVLPIAGHTRGENCMTSPNLALLQSRRKVWHKSRHSTVSKKTCAACQPINGTLHDRTAQNPLSTHSNYGSPKTAPVSQPNRRPEKP